MHHWECIQTSQQLGKYAVYDHALQQWYTFTVYGPMGSIGPWYGVYRAMMGLFWLLV